MVWAKNCCEVGILGSFSPQDWRHQFSSTIWPPLMIQIAYGQSAVISAVWIVATYGQITAMFWKICRDQNPKSIGVSESINDYHNYHRGFNGVMAIPGIHTSIY